MTIVFVDRTNVQNAFAALLTSALSSLVQDVYAYQVAELAKKQANIVVTSSGSNRRNPFKSPRNQSLIYIDVHVLVLYADTANSWTEAQSEARLNAIEAKINEVVADNQDNANWMSIDFAGKTEIAPQSIGGFDYRYEVIPLAFEVRA